MPFSCETSTRLMQETNMEKTSINFAIWDLGRGLARLAAEAARTRSVVAKLVFSYPRCLMCDISHALDKGV